MYKPTLCAWHVYKSRASGEHVDVIVVTDRPDHYRRVDLERMFTPWSSWMNIRVYLAVTSGDAPSLTSVIHPHDVVILLVDDDAIASAVREQVLNHSVNLLEPRYPEPGLENDLIREVAHHDFELGGRNEWDGSPTKHSDVVLRRLSSAHCYEEFPHWAFSGLTPSHVADVLDVGCGPISVLRWGSLTGLMRVTGLDPLLEMYRVVLARHGLDRLEGMSLEHGIVGTGECIPDLVKPGSFDAVFTNNALDHTQHPREVMSGIEYALKPGGHAVIQGATREGTRQNWDQLHKTDIFMEAGTVYYAHRDRVAQPLLEATPSLVLDQVHIYNAEWISFSLLKTD